MVGQRRHRRARRIGRPRTPLPAAPRRGRRSTQKAGLVIRPAVLADLPALAALEEELFGDDAWNEALVRQEIEGPGRRFVVSEDGAGRLDGYAVTMTAGDIVDLLRIAVRAESRRTGLASRLLDELLVDTDDASRMLLEVSVSNASALGFYVARQFSVIDVRPHYYRDGSEALVMCRWLPGAARAETATRND
ncbi:GNAT family N-acetyltransferase [Nocardioides zhouii]|uniref:GNAT family N-acetyltransferase n=1 Tax=Nocardioides zhouii TaxID=1168729 RepID=A0A4Q2T3C7_9ACTN|nr:GNAT family N-acetyltransferase [Nocardioides zhouii]